MFLSDASDAVGLCVLTEHGIPLRMQSFGAGASRKTVRERLALDLAIADEVVCIARLFHPFGVALTGQVGETSGIVKSQLWLACQQMPRVVTEFDGEPEAIMDIARTAMIPFGKVVEDSAQAFAFVAARWLWGEHVRAEDK